MRALIFVLALLAPTPFAQSVDTKALADGLVHELRALQNEDGTYGSGIEDTCRVLDLLARSPRRYNELDGPFFRKAADAVLEAGVLDLDGWRALALAGCVGERYVAEREAIIDRLAERSVRFWGQMTFAELYALNRLAPERAPRPPQHIVNFGSPALRLLCATDPERVPPPGKGKALRWVRWASAARLRGVEVTRWPEPPPPSEGRDLTTLLDDLEHVIAVHGLGSPADASDAGDDEPPAKVETPRQREAALRASFEWLLAHQDGGTFGLEVPGWEGPEPGVTAMLLSATVWLCDALDEPLPAWVDLGLDWLAGLQDADGAIALYGVRTYTTSVAMEALIDRGRPDHAPVVARALEFLRSIQADEGEGYDAEIDPHYGGVGYGGDERPDLSNTQMAVEAARRAGLGLDDEFFHKAMVFLERNHNLGEERVDEWPRAAGGRVVSGTDGGATYMPGSSPAGEQQVGDDTWVARSYGSMTYALTKSYLLCGLEPDSPRVQAAVTWLADNFSLETNPGFDDPSRGQDGLYYYYLAMARTLSRLPDSALMNSTGQRVAWREQLDQHLRANQRVDGTWINPASARWYEGSPALCTAYALLTLRAADA